MSENTTMKWERSYVLDFIQAFCFEEKLFYEAWKCKVSNDKVRLCLIDHTTTKKFGEIRHMAMQTALSTDETGLDFIDWLLTVEEPTYAQKLDTMKEIGTWKKCGLEVFPTGENLVDRADIYHVWELSSKELLPFSLDPIFDLPQTFEEISVKGVQVEYAMRVLKTEYGKMAYLYLKPVNRQELRWKEKQAIKDEIVGDETAVEVICEEAKDLPYTCLVCLPMNYELDFGLHIERE